MPDTRPLSAKLVEFDHHAAPALNDLLDFMQSEGQALIIQARGRLVRGHYAFGDRYMFELSEQQLLGEVSEEIADAINYFARRRALGGGE